MSKYERINLDKIKTISILDRNSKVKINDFATTFKPNNNFSDFIDSLPNILIAKDFKEFSARFANAVIKKKTICVMMGAHVIKVGLAPLIIELIRNKWISSISMNGAGIIHDVELSLWGKTSEDVAENLQNGTFGMSAETAQFINNTLKKNIDTDLGYGEAIGKKLLEQSAPNKEQSILCNAYINSIPVTVHVGIGTDIIYQHSNMDAAAAGELSYRDFKILCNVLQSVGNGGIVLNIGSAVILPEVFLKALTVVRNLGKNAFNFTTATFDMIHQYRSKVNVVERPTSSSGKGYYFIGHHEIMIPLLVASIKNLIRAKSGKK